MLAPNDAVLTRVFTTSIDSDVANSQPNLCLSGPARQFRVCVEAVAGHLIGNSCLHYTLNLTCIDEVLAAPNNAMSRLGVIQQFSKQHGWKPHGCAGTYVKRECFVIDVPPHVKCHVFHYIVTLCDNHGNIASFLHSAPFILVDGKECD
ncbi:hypothetical protein [Streptomyces sp. NPDC053048]|uniref:hypothetical protein n=1 Tax=Streptomyces sp. NPDC053048 TaxID=3365694 RepID=UPI0037D1E641